ncbi:hypothetical protein AOLI_G00126260 [Acnodon oligacanthus]
MAVEPEAHHKKTGHQGVERTMSLLRRHFYWVGMEKSAAKNKRLYDRTAHISLLLPGERVLVRDNRRWEKGKLGNRWEPQPYVIVRQQSEGVPVYIIRPEGKSGADRMLHWNSLRPCLRDPVVPQEPPSTKDPEATEQWGWFPVGPWGSGSGSRP